MTAVTWGIDLGGTKVEGILLDDTLTPLIRKRVPTESHKGYDHIISRVVELVSALRTESGLEPEHIGIGTPGISDPHTGLMKNCNTTALIGRPFWHDLQRELEVPITLANDANCFALAEARLGAGRGARSMFGVIMGTGVGGGLVYRGEIVQGLHGIGGEWGHNVLLDDGPRCYCGKYGCVETFLSGPFLERFYHSLSGTARALPDIVVAARGGADPAAAATVDRLHELFGRALSVVINIVDPEVVVLGGGVSNVDSLYTGGVEALGRHIFHDRMQTRIERNQLGDSAGVFGAALLRPAE